MKTATYRTGLIIFRLILVAEILCLPRTCFSDDLAESLKPVIESHQGEVAVIIRHLDTGEEFTWRGDDVQPTASLIKLPVMVTAYRMADRTAIDLQKVLTLAETDKVPGSGILTDHLSVGMTISLRDAIRLMIRYSDNTATNMVVDQIGLPATAAEMKELGFSETRLNSKVYRGDTSIDPDRSKLYGLGSTTAKETVAILEGIHKGTIASPESCKAMLDHLHACDDKSMLARDLPAGTKVAHKTGAVSASRCDAGIVFGPKGPFAICVLTTDNSDRQWTDENAAQKLMGKIALIAFDHFNPEWQRRSDDVGADLKLGAFGSRVEMLQRTLNARLSPSPNLGVDGDFGPATEAAVKQFQVARQLEATGVANSDVWKALGPVVEEATVPEPAIVNAEMPTKQPAEPLEGAPFVTSDAWTIVDASDGRVLASHQADMKTHFASTTKMMTAWLVVHAAQKQPDILDEVIIMSKRADETRGSTADIREGESLTVRESLYGLMLPSGNDMSVALAEHFGGRIGADEVLSERPADLTEDPLPLFVKAMNDEADRLGMTSTHYENPHGLSVGEHLSTANDLAILARTAFESELYRQYTGTRQHGTTVNGASGYQRNVVWKNTNELLGTEGYDGIKTGTTDLAGACLVSTGVREDRRLFVVVLGAAASEARYTDSRNLYRWAWSKL